MSGIHDMDPELAALIEQERSAGKRRDKYMPRLKIEKNCSYLVRLVMVPVGRGFFSRKAEHWINRKPYFCATKSSPTIGGDPDYECKLCAEIEHIISSSKSKTAVARAEECESYPRYGFYGVCFEVERNGRIERAPAEASDFLNEITVNHSAFEGLISYYQRGLKRSKLSIFDPIDGTDIWIRKDKSGKLSLDREDPAPITKNKPHELYDRLLSEFKLEHNTPLEGDSLEEAMDKLNDYVFGGERGSDNDRGGRSSRSGRDEDSGRESRGESRGESRSSRSEGSRGSRASADDRVTDDDPGVNDRNSDTDLDESRPEERARDSRSSRQSEALVSARDVDDRPARSSRDEAPARGESARGDSDRGRSGSERTAARQEPARQQESEREATPPPARRGTPPPPPARREATPPPARGRHDDDELPDEASDAAPPIRDDAPAAASPAASSSKPASRLSSAMRERLKFPQD